MLMLGSIPSVSILNCIFNQCFINIFELFNKIWLLQRMFNLSWWKSFWLSIFTEPSLWQPHTATYHRELGFSAAKRGEEHKSGIDKADLSNSFAKHLHVHHPERERDSSAFEFKVVRNFKKPLNRQVFEGVRIYQLDTLMNSKSEFHQPAATRVTTVREVRSSGT